MDSWIDTIKAAPEYCYALSSLTVGNLMRQRINAISQSRDNSETRLHQSRNKKVGYLLSVGANLSASYDTDARKGKGFQASLDKQLLRSSSRFKGRGKVRIFW
jgi:hypothetical protein